MDEAVLRRRENMLADRQIILFAVHQLEGQHRNQNRWSNLALSRKEGVNARHRGGSSSFQSCERGISIKAGGAI
jgi:hypothetical protein